VLGPLGVGERSLLFQQVLMEFIDHTGIGLPALGKLGLIPRSKPLRRKVEERKFAEQLGLKLVVLSSLILLIRRDAAASVDRSSAVGALHIEGILGFTVLPVVVIEERDVRIV